MLDNSYWKIPEHTYKALKNYIEKRHPPGNFLTAVLTNDLFGAAMTADDENKKKLYEICGFVYNEIPSIAWRTKEKIQDWMKIPE